MVEAKRRILVVDNDLDVCGSLKAYMQADSTDVCCAATASEAVECLMKQNYCLVILSAHLSEISVMEMLRIIRLAKSVPILALTTILSQDEKVALFQAGADAIIEEPFSVDLCVAQAEALIQLYSGAGTGRCQKDQIPFGTELTIIPRYRQVLVDGKPLTLTRKEFDLLHCFATHPYQVFSREQLYAHIWDDGFATAGDETVRVHVQRLRRKLAARGKNLIHNVRGVGYKFVPPNG